MKISLIIPAKNEEKRIKQTLKDYSNYLDKKLKKQKIDYKIIVVVNDSIDNTEGIVNSFSLKNKRIILKKTRQVGKGTAIKQGFLVSLKQDFDYISFVDADNSISTEQFNKLFNEIIKNKQIDGIIASRHLKNSIVPIKQPLERRILSRLFNSTIKILFRLKYKDTQCGAKIFRKKVIKKIAKKLKIKGFIFDVDILIQCKKNNFSIKEFAIEWNDKQGTKLKKIKTLIETIKDLKKLLKK